MGEDEDLRPESGEVLTEPEATIDDVVDPLLFAVPNPRMKLRNERLWLSAGDVSLQKKNKMWSIHYVNLNVINFE